MSKKMATVLKVGAVAAGVGITCIPVGGPIVGALELSGVSSSIVSGGIDLVAGHFLGKVGDKVQDGMDHAIDDASKTKKEKAAEKTKDEQKQMSHLVGDTHNSNGRSVASTVNKFNQDQDQLKQKQPSYLDQLIDQAGTGIDSNVSDAKAQAHEL